MTASFFAHREGNFQRISKIDPRSDFVEWGSEILYLFFEEKWSFVLLQYFVLLTLFFNRSSREAEKEAVNEKNIRCKAWKLLNL